jgi:peroxiredoxin
MSSVLARSLVGTSTPAIVLPATSGSVDLRELCAGRATLFVYPATGDPGRDPAVDPAPGWDDIPGAAGCTPQCLGFKSAYSAFCNLGVRVAGLSSQPLEEQQGFAERHGLEYPLVCDAKLQFAAALSIPTFTAGDRTFYKRLVLYFVENRIVRVVDDLPLPADSARLMLDLLNRDLVPGCPVPPFSC